MMASALPAGQAAALIEDIQETPQLKTSDVFSSYKCRMLRGTWETRDNADARRKMTPS
jgi:hypothetical protein